MHSTNLAMTNNSQTSLEQGKGTTKELQLITKGVCLATERPSGFLEGGDCRSFLLSPPSYVTDTRGAPMNVQSSSVFVERFLQDVLKDHINAINAKAALEVQPFIADTSYYPLHVLLQASCQALGWTPVFLLDSLYSVCCSFMQKDVFTQLACYKNRHRYWSNRVAPAGAGKSPSMKPLVTLALAVPRRSEKDDFHFQQSSTTAACIDKSRQCDAYVLLWSTDAGRCLSEKFARGGETDMSKHVDLTFVLDAAHGEEFSHQTMQTRQAMGKSCLHGSFPTRASQNERHTQPDKRYSSLVGAVEVVCDLSLSTCKVQSGGFGPASATVSWRQSASKKGPPSHEILGGRQGSKFTRAILQSRMHKY